MPHALYIPFVFALGACVGSFLNVVVWRLPRVEYRDGEGVLRSFWRSFEALSYPGSHCPKCNHALKWYDNLPVVGWVKLGGKCRTCKQPISPRYPIVEAVTGALFVVYYVCYFILGVGPCLGPPAGALAEEMPRLMYRQGALAVPGDLPIYFLSMALVSGLLAASLIDAELFVIPLEIPWVLAVVGVAWHALFDGPGAAGALSAEPRTAALALGGGIGLAASMALWGRGAIPTSFPQGEVLDVDRENFRRDADAARAQGREHDEDELPDYTPAQVRAEIRKEMLFLLPPLVLAAVFWTLAARPGPIHDAWFALLHPRTGQRWLAGMLGAVYGGLVGGVVVWFTRIVASFAFGRVAMGLGDVHLMLGVGAVVGAGASTVAFFVAPFFGIVVAVYRIVTRRSREVPYGPYLSMATGFVLLFYCPIAAWLAPGLAGLGMMLFGGAGS